MEQKGRMVGCPQKDPRPLPPQDVFLELNVTGGQRQRWQGRGSARYSERYSGLFNRPRGGGVRGRQAAKLWRARSWLYRRGFLQV